MHGLNPLPPLLLLTSLGLMACDSAGTTPGGTREGQPPSNSAEEAAKWIFTVWGASATVTDAGDGSHVFTLTGPAANAVMWTDRPDRLSQPLPVGALTSTAQWTALYGDMPPNAGVSVQDARGRRVLKTLVLTDPVVTLTDSACVQDAQFGCAVASVAWQIELLPLNGSTAEEPQLPNLLRLLDTSLTSVSITFAHTSADAASALYTSFSEENTDA